MQCFYLYLFISQKILYLYLYLDLYRKWAVASQDIIKTALSWTCWFSFSLSPIFWQICTMILNGFMDVYPQWTSEIGVQLIVVVYDVCVFQFEFWLFVDVVVWRVNLEKKKQKCVYFQSTLSVHMCKMYSYLFISPIILPKMFLVLHILLQLISTQVIHHHYCI